MARVKEQLPAVEGWFSTGEEPALIGGRCGTCGTYSFPREALYCRNPDCDAGPSEEVALSRRGRVWSYTDACYGPPPPFVAVDPFVPFCIAAVELATEKMVVMGQVAGHVGVDELAIGDEVELITDVLYEDDDHEYLVWKWQPVTRRDPRPGARSAKAQSAGSTGSDSGALIK
ncbi:MAG TPA: OB-fold domain-containing protein [Acidimicrobiales bacterium]|nr:OB-fold domain-containing protein [Acidimicrobiales bacterium]